MAIRNKSIKVISAIALVIVATSIILLLSNRKEFSPTDVNRDGVTNQLDQEQLLKKFGQQCEKCTEDINLDNKVDGEDLLILISEFGY